MNLRRFIAYSAGLRARISWLVAISFLPVFLFALYASVQNQRERLEWTHADLLAISSQVALAGERRIEGTRQLLNSLAVGLSLNNQNLSELCAAFLANTSHYSNVGLLDPAGGLRCSAVPGVPAGNFSDRSYFKEAIETRSFVIGEYQQGRITALPRLSFSMPVYDGTGVLKGVAFAALDVANMDFSPKTALPASVDLTITDRNGVIIGTDVSQGNRVGQQLSDQALAAAMKNVPDKAFEGVDPQGVEKIYAVTKTGDARPGKGIYVMLSVPRDVIIAPLQKQLAWTMLLIAALALAGVTIARWIGARTILDPTQKLLEKVNQLAGVDVSRPANTHGKRANEIVGLSDAFDRMTDILKANEKERTQSEAVLRVAQRRLLDAQRIGSIGNWEYDIKADEVWWSDQIYVIYGLDVMAGPNRIEDVLAKVHPDDMPDLEVARDLLRKGKGFDLEYRVVVDDGQIRWVHSLAEATYDRHGALLTFSGTIQDITPRMQAQEELKTLYAELDLRVQDRTAELQRANQELEAFSYSVSHDLRSPLNTIGGFSQLLEKVDGSSISEKGKHYLARIRSGATQMGELIEGLLALARVSREELRYEQVNLSQLARNVERGCREREPDRKVEVLIQDDLMAWGDPRLLLATLQNLIGNAWKFTARAEFARIEFLSEMGSDDTTCFMVRDNGAGFSMESADKLFGTFQRLHSQDDFSGTGVGLTIVKRVVEKHGGRIWATSKVGEGAIFRFTLGKST